MINQLELLFSGPFKFMDKGAEERARGAREQVPRKSKTKNGSEVVERPPPKMETLRFYFRCYSQVIPTLTT